MDFNIVNNVREESAIDDLENERKDREKMGGEAKQGDVIGSQVNSKSEAQKSKKWCLYELHQRQSCPFGEKCKFSHEVPENGQQIMDSWFKKCKKMNNNELSQLSNNLDINARNGGKLHHFLVNVIKEMISKEIIQRKQNPTSKA